TKQTTENFISYKSLGIDESQEEQKNAAKAKIEELSKQYQTVKGIKEKVSFDKNGIKENIEIDYDKADLK
ncbi:YehR family protein, partial [Lachnoclostridium sp. 210928-DFI.6.3]|nr:YehR family protein [Lachnoclostridium sp. 210928-DFI.6.3]